MSIVYLYLMKDAQLFFWDEYSHWGAFIKEMYYFHHFYDANSVAAHLRYPPGISVWDYFILLPYGFYSEGSLYFAYFLILFSSVLMMYEKLQWRQYYWIVTIFASQMILFATYGHWFSCIYVDHIIGAMFAGMLLAYLVDTYTDKELLYFIFPAIAIVLVKEIGLFFVLSFVGLVLLLSFYNAKHKNSALGAIKEIKKIVLAMLIVFISSFLVLKLWDSNRDSFLIPKENQSISGIVKSIISDEKVLDAKTQEEVKKRFWEVVQNQQLHKEKVSLNYNEFSYDIMNQYQKEYKLSTFGTLLFFLLIVTFAYFVAYEKDRKKSSLIIGGYLVCVAMGYLLLLYFSFQVAFGEGALRIPSYVRYMNMSVLALLMLAIYLFLPAYEAKYNQNIIRKAINAKLVLLLFVISLFTAITQPYFQPLYTQFENGFRKQIDAVVPKIIEHMPYKSNVLVVFPVKNNGSLDNIIRYAMIPTKATMANHDFFSAKTEEEVLKEYSKYDFIWFASMDENVIEKSRQILKQKDKNSIYSLYKLEKSDNQISVKPIL